MDFLISIIPFTTNPGSWHICAEYILTRSDSPLDRDVVKMDPLLANMTNNVFLPIFAIILPKMLTLCYPVHFETLPVIY